tara:strand:+ start:299 stop:769 length:471 start_codon:yes stop_codon:yes gene_type:complete
MNYIYLTKEGFDNLKAELHDLKTRGRLEASSAIAEAREKGDLSENAEYDAAKEAQGLLEKKISELNDSFSRARVIDESQLDASKVVLLSKVEVRNVKLDKVFSYQIVAGPEADLSLNKISVDSPIGKGLLGKKEGDTAEIQVPAGSVEFEILSIRL